MNFVRGSYDNRTSVVLIFLFDRENFFLDDVFLKFFTVENSLKFRDEFSEVFQLFFKVIYFEFGDSRKSQIEDCLSLFFGKIESGSQIRLCGGRIGRSFDNSDNFVDIRYGDNQAFQDVRSFFCFVKVVFRSSYDDVYLIIDVILYYLEKPHKLRLAVRYGDHIYSVSTLKLSVFE